MMRRVPTWSQSLSLWNRAGWAVAGYLLFGVLWITGSDNLLATLDVSEHSTHAIALAKGLLFVVISAGWGLALLWLALPITTVQTGPALTHSRSAALLAWMLVCILSIPLIAGGIFQLQARQLETSTQAALRALAETEANRLGDWLHERSAATGQLANDAWVVESLTHPDRGDLRERLLQHLQRLALAGGHHSILIRNSVAQVHAQVGTPMISTGQGPALPVFDTRAARPGAPEEVEATIHESRLGPYLRLRSPVLSQGQIIGWVETDRLLSDALLSIVSRDGNATLTSQETLVTLQQNNAQVLLLATRTHAATPKLIRYATSPELPATMASKANAPGVLVGQDYRKHPVIAGYAPVPDSPWRVIVKIDRDELRDTLLPMIAWIGATLSLGFLMLAWALLVLWRGQREAEARSRLHLQKNNDRLMQQFFELPFVGMAITSPQTKRWLRFNDHLCDILGYPRDELAQLSWAEITHPDDLEKNVTLFEQAMAGTLDTYSLEKRFVRKDGGIVHAFIDVKCVRRPDHSVEFFVSTIDDISEEVRARDALMASEARLRSVVDELRETATLYREIFESNPQCLYVWDAVTRELLAVNHAVIERYGWSRDELLQMRLEDLRPADQQAHLLASIAALDRQRINQPGIFVHQRRDGSQLRVELALHAMQFAGRSAWLTMALDVTEREQARAERDQYIQRLEASTDSILAVIAAMVELRDPYTAGHERRVGEIAADIAAEMGLGEHTQQGLRICGAVHDVGKIAVPAEILSKPTRLNAAEYRLVQDHATMGYEILKGIDLPWPIAEVARQHHERLDGSGYPRGLKGDEILLEARIVAVADVIESMASHRPYRVAVGLSLALAEVEQGRGSAFDPAVVDACLRLFRDKGYALPT